MSDDEILQRMTGIAMGPYLANPRKFERLYRRASMELMGERLEELREEAARNREAIKIASDFIRAIS